MESINLTKKLISIPSYVEGQENEAQIGTFIYQYLQKFPWLTVTKQFIDKNRFNVIARDKYETNVMLVGHIDTVQKQDGWKTDPCTPIEKNRKIYGLGASDMKGSLASMLSAIKLVGPTNGMMYFFYIDEEYDFLGVKKFIEEFKGKITPKVIISGDGGDLKFGVACRGLIEIRLEIKGESGHAARPTSGKSAILGALRSIEGLTRDLRKYTSEALGESSLNVSFIRGGLNQGLGEEETLLGKQGNIIPDYCEFIVDIRPAAIELNAKRVISIIEKYIEIEGCTVKCATVRHDFGAWNTNTRDVKVFTNLFPVGDFVSAKQRGYVDLQMLWSSFGKVPCLTFGPGKGELAHKPNEYIEIASLTQAEDYFFKLISMYNQKDD